MKTLKKIPEAGLKQVYFNAASAAAMSAFRKHGHVPVSVFALVETKGETEMFPVKLELSNSAAESFLEKLEEAIIPLVERVLSKPESRVVLFFSSIAADTVFIDEGHVLPRNAKILINASRTEDHLGKSETYEVPSDDSLLFNSLEVSDWQEVSAKAGITQREASPARVAQMVLEKIWLTYVMTRNIMKTHD